jgi:hypothetical protein
MKQYIADIITAMTTGDEKTDKENMKFFAEAIA